MICTFYAWDDMQQRFEIILTCSYGSAQYENGMKTLIVKYKRGYITCNGKKIFKWSWT